MRLNIMFRIFVVCTYLAPSPNFAMIDEDEEKDSLISRVLPYVLPTPDKTLDLKEELQCSSLEELKRMVELAQTILPDKKAGEEVAKFAYTRLLDNIINQIPSEEQEHFLEKLRPLITPTMSLQEKKDCVDKIIAYIVSKPTFKDGEIFSIENDLKIQYKEAFQASALPEVFMNDIDERDKQLMRLTKRLTTFLVLQGDTIIGYRPFDLRDKNTIEGEVYVLAKEYRGKGIGKKAYLQMMKIWAADQNLGKRDHVVLEGVTEGGRALINSLIKDGLGFIKKEQGTYLNQSPTLKVTFKMDDIKRFFNKK